MLTYNIKALSILNCTKKFCIFRICNTAGMKSEFFHEIYQQLTPDSTAARDREMQKRALLALQGEPGIITDLRHLCPGKPGGFTEFFDCMGDVINEVNYNVLTGNIGFSLTSSYAA